ncbi:MAG: hypothetical protein ACLFSQ_05595 [Candidatus Zixiibacteriota bacterium]
MSEKVKQYDELWLKRRSLQSPLLNVSFEKHDNTSIEIDLNYFRKKQFESEKQNYKIEFFFFFPVSLRLVKKGYKAKDFFDTMINNLRMRSPKILPSEYFDDTEEEYPIYKLKILKKKMLHNMDFDETELVIKEFKLLANYLISYFKKVNILDCSPPGLNVSKHLELEMELSREMLNHFRNIFLDFKETFSNRFPGLIDNLSHIDEYISYMLESNWSEVYQSLYGDKEFKYITNSISETLNAEIEYRQNTNYRIPSQERGDIKEYFVYRLGVLKKYIQKQLYLNEKYVKSKNYLMQIIAMSAAGLAAFVALMLESMKNIISPVIGIPAGALVLASVLIYILKDRIKDLIKAIIGKKALQKYDRERVVIIPSKHREVFAKTKESITISKKDKINPNIRQMRNADLTFDIDRTKLEDVVYYSKLISIDWKKLEKNIPSIISGLKEIYRFNLSDFMTTMDDPKHVYPAWNPNKRKPEIVEFNKVYHVNILLKLTSFVKKEDYTDENYYRVRLILDRHGVRRIEQIPIENCQQIL